MQGYFATAASVITAAVCSDDPEEEQALPRYCLPQASELDVQPIMKARDVNCAIGKCCFSCVQPQLLLRHLNRSRAEGHQTF